MGVCAPCFLRLHCTYLTGGPPYWQEAVDTAKELCWLMLPTPIRLQP